MLYMTHDYQLFDTAYCILLQITGLFSMGRAGGFVGVMQFLLFACTAFYHCTPAFFKWERQGLGVERMLLLDIYSCIDIF